LRERFAFYLERFAVRIENPGQGALP